jgi:hypothetical protein
VKVEHCNCLSRLIANDEVCIRVLEIKSKIVMEKAAFNKKNALFIRKVDLNLRNKLVQ